MSLFAHKRDSPIMKYDLSGALVMRAFFVSAALVELWRMFEAVAEPLVEQLAGG
jgi:hypothetical protein